MYAELSCIFIHNNLKIEIEKAGKDFIIDDNQVLRQRAPLRIVLIEIVCCSSTIDSLGL